MKKILLVYPPHDANMYPPIGLATLAGHLEKTGNEVRALDSVELGLTRTQIIKRTMKYDPDEIWVSVPFTEMAVSARLLLDLLAIVFPDKKVLAGGHHVEVCPDEFSDYLVCSDCAGTNIDPNTRPAWHLLDPTAYNMTMYLSTKERAMPIQSSFGCPFACAFCRNSVKREKTRRKDIDVVMDEIRWITQDFGIRGFHFWDETFTLNNDRLARLCARMIHHELDIHWSAQTRLGITDPTLIQLMKDAGCVRISFGVESGDEKVLKSINKGIALNGAGDEIRRWRDAGIVTYAGYMIGHAKDTVASVAKTMEVSRALNTDYAGFRIAIPYPSSVFRKQAEAKGRILTSNWSHYRDDAVVYVPAGLEGYDIKRIKGLAEDYFDGAVSGTAESAIRERCKHATTS